MIIYDLARIWLPAAEEWCLEEPDRRAPAEASPVGPAALAPPAGAEDEA